MSRSARTYRPGRVPVRRSTAWRSCPDSFPRTAWDRRAVAVGFIQQFVADGEAHVPAAGFPAWPGRPSTNAPELDGIAPSQGFGGVVPNGSNAAVRLFIGDAAVGTERRFETGLIALRCPPHRLNILVRLPRIPSFPPNLPVGCVTTRYAGRLSTDETACCPSPANGEMGGLPTDDAWPFTRISGGGDAVEDHGRWRWPPAPHRARGVPSAPHSGHASTISVLP